MSEVEPILPASKILRGSKIRIYPLPRQAAMMDIWRRRCISLWNLLLSFEQAAYSGENVRAELVWRQILVKTMEENYAGDDDIYRHGKKKKDGSVIKEPGISREDERLALKKSLKILKPNTREFERIKGKLKLIAAQPKALDPIVLAKLLREAPTEIDPETGEVCPHKLFIWKRELLALMARLKQSRTQWIGDLPSHAAQKVADDLVVALETMLSERRKRASGNGGRDTGFPRYKKSRYAAGSVYFANTQMSFDFDARRVKLSNGVGSVRYDGLPFEQDAAKKIVLMGGRIWRRGEKWFLSCQWKIPALTPLPPSSREAGVRLGAAILLTTFDERGQTKEYFPLEIDKQLVRRHKLAGRKLARQMRVQTDCEKRKTKRKSARRAELQKRQEEAGLDGAPGSSHMRLRRSKNFFETCAYLAKLEGHVADGRDDHLHKITTEVVKKFGAIQVQKMDVAKMMQKKKKRLARHEAKEAKMTSPRSLKPVRKLMRNAAPGRIRQLLAYKARDWGRDYGETDRLEPIAQTCHLCGTVNPKMRDGRRVLNCDGCGKKILRNRNAAGNEQRLLQSRLAKKSTS